MTDELRKIKRYEELLKEKRYLRENLIETIRVADAECG